MRSYNTVGGYLGSVLLTAAWLGCSGGTADSDGNTTESQAALAPIGTVSMSDSSACIVTVEAPLLLSADVQRTSVTSRWLSYDSELHLLRDIAVDEQGNPLALDETNDASSYTTVSDQGRTLIAAREVGSGTLQRADYARDSHGNLRSYRQTRTASRALSAPSTEPLVAYDFVNHYQSSGLLVKHNRADSSASISYTHDSNGRCSSIVDDFWSERREYDAAGRLSIQRVDPLDPLAPTETGSEPASSVTTHRYDDQGRPLAIEQDGGGASTLPLDGKPDVLTRWSYGAQGGWVVEYIDFGSDTPNDTLDRDGQLVRARHRWESWSPGCEAVQASIPVRQGAACATD